MAVSWSGRVGEAQWWVDRLHPFSRHDNGSVIPEGFEVYLRLFHPIDADLDGRPASVTTWTALARANNRVAHCDMQLHGIGAPPGTGVSWRDAQIMSWTGSQEPESLITLATILADHTYSPGKAWFAIWDGFGRTDCPDGLPKVYTDARDYYLVHGSVTEAVPAKELANGSGPNVWWPADRAWIVASEIDFAWTFVACSEQAARAIESEASLETYRCSPHHRSTFDADTINVEP